MAAKIMMTKPHSGHIPRGQRHPKARFTDAQIHEFRARHKAGESINSLAREVETPPGYMSRLVNNKSRTRDAQPLRTEYGNAARGTADMTLADIGMMFGVTLQAVQNIEQRALRKIRAVIEREASRAGCTPLEWLFGDE